MDSIIVLLKDTPIPTILVVSGIVFLFLALAGQVAGKLEVPPARQKWAAAVGAVFLGAGLLLYLSPDFSRASQAEMPSNPVQAAAAQQDAAPAPPVAGTAQQAQSQPASSSVQSGASDSPDLEGMAGCLDGFFSGIAADRIVQVESGTASKVLLSAQQSKKEPSGLVLLELGQPVVALSYFFFEEDALFKIGSLVDGACQPVEYTNGSRGGDKNVLQNWDTLEVTSGEYVYAMRFDYSGGVVGLGTSKFQR
jgi:hypothetical protein